MEALKLNAGRRFARTLTNLAFGVSLYKMAMLMFVIMCLVMKKDFNDSRSVFAHFVISGVVLALNAEYSSRLKSSGFDKLWANSYIYDFHHCALWADFLAFIAWEGIPCIPFLLLLLVTYSCVFFSSTLIVCKSLIGISRIYEVGDAILPREEGDTEE